MHPNPSSLVFAALLICLLAACGPLTPLPAPLPAPVNTLEPSATATRLPPFVKFLPGSLTQPPYVSRTPPPRATVDEVYMFRTETPLPGNWKTYTNPALNLSLRYPSNWQVQTSAPGVTRASGPDGFFELSTRAFRPSSFIGVLNLCVLDANDPALSALYGPLPAFHSSWRISNVDGIDNCMVVPSTPAGTQAVAYIRDPLPEAREQVLVFHADVAHFSGLLSSLEFSGFIPETPVVDLMGSPFCDEAPQGEALITRQVGELQISEYALANATCQPWKNFDGFQARVRKLKFDREALESRATAMKLDSANRALAPFGYRVGLHPPSSNIFDLFRGTQLVLGNFHNLGPVMVNAAGDDFILWVMKDGLENSQYPVEIRSAGLQTYLSQEEGNRSTWAGADLIRYEYAASPLSSVGAHLRADITSNGATIQTLSIPAEGPAGPYLHGLWSWQGHWVMLVKDSLFENGELQNLKLGYDEIFDWHLVNEKPFFLMSGKKGFGMVYDGQELPIYYDDLLHGLCCGYGVYNVQDFATGSLFYALRDGVWYLVVVTVVTA